MACVIACEWQTATAAARSSLCACFWTHCRHVFGKTRVDRFDCHCDPIQNCNHVHLSRARYACLNGNAIHNLSAMILPRVMAQSLSRLSTHTFVHHGGLQCKVCALQRHLSQVSSALARHVCACQHASQGPDMKRPCCCKAVSVLRT
jgi:hypothetical protein